MTKKIPEPLLKTANHVRKKSNEVIDRVLGKIVSRKLTVFIVASYGMFHGNIDSSDWTIIGAIYIGSETAISIIKEFYKIKFGIYGQDNTRQD
jgi:hypothetical protein